MKTPEPFSIRRRRQSFIHAFEGLKILIQTQHNARIHAVFGIAIMFLAWWLQIGRIKFILIVWAIVSVWIAEAFNTSCEILLDIVAEKYSAKVKHAKDIAAAAVLIASVGAFLTGLLLLGPPFWQRVSPLISPWIAIPKA